MEKDNVRLLGEKNAAPKPAIRSKVEKKSKFRD